ncbi:hypothetical protein LY28_02409 [Ruminiclostridium sufflavum DSM 19573]|uniref:Uncharacterized protein n=1 Tax=Ruminiclostridium sufflavum DSM 19573 TaxID=1121337 RepID=A0A318XW54_9FIRM|nr:hypothetical protein [Ruminiclostridium sufflavum]PYG87027.1 hypothetical protein LY28_02409 [Ruminiclostridium sufflavum DSM 19573]
MPPYNRKHKVSDIEKPISTNILGRDIFGVNTNIPAIRKTSIDLQDEEQNLEFINKIK